MTNKTNENSNEIKACFLLLRRFAYVGHAMALIFQKKYDIKEFCGFVRIRDSFKFLKSQKDIQYSQLLLDEDIFKQYKKESLDLNYINNLEQEYGIPNLWPYITADRLIRYNMLLREYPHNTPKFTHEEIMRIFQVEAKAIIKFLEEERPDFIFFSVIGDLSTMLLYYIAKKKGIKTFIIRNTCVGKRFTITENYNTLEYVDKTYNDIQKNTAPYQKYIEQAKKFLNDFRDKPSPYSSFVTPKAKPINRKKQFAFLLPQKMFQSIIWFIKILYGYISDKNRDDYSNIKPWHYLLDRIKRKTRVLIGFDDLYDEINLSEDFVFFPLQHEPEASTMFYAPFYNDQLWIIKQIANSLPLHYKLYVKEHPAMFGYRPRRYYKELKKIPNVRLIKPTITSFDLIKNSKLVTAITGTAGWEATLLKKPVITFGNAFYNTLPMLKRCRAIEDLPKLIKEQLENFNYDEKSLINFIAAILKESASVDLIQLWHIEGGGNMEKKEEELVPLVDLIAEKLNLKPIKNNL